MILSPLPPPTPRKNPLSTTEPVLKYVSKVNADVPKLIPGESVSEVDELVSANEFAVNEAAEELAVAATTRGAEGSDVVATPERANELLKIPGVAETILRVPVVETPPGAPLTVTVGVSDEDDDTVV